MNFLLVSFYFYFWWNWIAIPARLTQRSWYEMYFYCFCPGQFPVRQLNISILDGWTTDDLKYQWKKEDPVQITKDLHLPRFTLEKYVSDYCNIKTNTGEKTQSSEMRDVKFLCSGEYSCLTVDLTFKREFSYYLLTIYVPCCMLVIVSWVSFWLDPNAVPARVSLGVTTLLTMSTQQVPGTQFAERESNPA